MRPLFGRESVDLKTKYASFGGKSIVEERFTDEKSTGDT
jgi:hypothetical protein